MSYTKQELEAIEKIAIKLGWHMPFIEQLETINQMVRNQQSLELDTVGECDDFEQTLLIIAQWGKDSIVSAQYVYDYSSLANWNFDCFCEDMGITPSDCNAMMDYYSALPERIEQEELDRLHDREMVEELEWYNHARQMGWE